MNLVMVMEQTLGHQTHYRNVRSYIDQNWPYGIDWIEIPFITSGWQRYVPVWNHWSVNASCRSRRRLAKLLDPKPDLVFFHTQTTSLFCCDLMKRVPSVISLDATPMNLERLGLSHFNHYVESHQPIARVKRYLNRVTKSALNQRAYEAAHAIVAWTSWVKDSLVNDYGISPEKVHVIPPGVDTERWGCSPRASTSLPVRILFVGGDFNRKGGPVLLEAWRKSLRDRSELHLVTNTPVKSEPGLHVYHNIRANTPELRRIFAEADVFALPTFADTFGIVFAEASASRLPIVATNVGGVADVVLDSKTGFLCNPGDVDGLCRRSLNLSIILGCAKKWGIMLGVTRQVCLIAIPIRLVC